MPLSLPPNASGTLSCCSIRIFLLNKDELQISVENKHIKISDLFKKACEYVGIKETEYFGLAQQKDGEFQFLHLETKLQKLASKLWKSKNLLSDKPLLTFYLRVQYYVNNISLLRDRTTRHQYYLQLRDNLLSHGQMVSEEKCFILASYALQADFDSYKPDLHVGAYFDPRKYFPAWVIMRRGQDYVTTNLPLMHKDMAYMTPAEARLAFIRELSSPPVCHNFHYYRLRRRKYDSTATMWLAICPGGLEIHEDVNGFKNQLSVFLWQNIEKIHCDKKKFEIVTDAVTERKFTYYAISREWGDHLLDLCRSTHHFQMTLQPRLAEMQHQEERDQHYREMYVHGGDMSASSKFRGLTSTPEHRPTSLKSSLKADQCGADGHSFNTVLENSILKTPNIKDNDTEEIMIISPPTMSSTMTTISPMSEPPEFSVWSCSHEQVNQKASPDPDLGRTFQKLPSFNGQWVTHGCGSFVSKCTVSSSSKPNSSVESLITGSPSSSNNPSIGQIQTSLSSLPISPIKLDRSSSKDDVKSWMASPVNSTSTWRSTSPSSSTSSGQLIFSLPPKQTLVDAALLRKSLPHGTSLNEYISRIISGEETKLLMPNFQKLPHRKSSLDQQQRMCLSFMPGEMISRSASLRQPKETLADKQGMVKTINTSPSMGKPSQDSQDIAISHGLVQPLPQVPVTAQMQKIVFPEKMTAISSAVRPVMGRTIGMPVDASVECLANSFLPERAVSEVFYSLHSTPLPSRYQRQQIHKINVPLSYDTAANFLSNGFDPARTVPNFAFPMTPVISTSEIDYSGNYSPSVLGYPRNLAANGISVYGQTPVMSSSTQNGLFLTPSQLLTTEALLSTRSDPPPYYEWQASRALSVLGANSSERKHSLAVRPAEQIGAASVDMWQLHLQNGLVNGIEENILSLSPYLNATHPVSLHDISTYTSVDGMYDLMKRLNNQEKVCQTRTVHADCNPYVTDGFGNQLSAPKIMQPASVSVQNLQQSDSTGKLFDESKSYKDEDFQKNMLVKEKLQNIATDLPMLNALLSDKSLFACQLNNKAVEPFGISSSDSAKQSDKKSRPISWHLERHHLHNDNLYNVYEPNVSEEIIIAMALDVIQKKNGSSGKVLPNRKISNRLNGIRHHSLDVINFPAVNDLVNHNQSHSDSAILSCGPIATEC